MNKIIIYTNKTCPYCKQIKEELTKNNIEFENRSTAEYKNEWQDVTFLTGMPSVPTILYEEEYFTPGRDFRNSQHLVDMIKNYKKSSFSNEKRILEHFKSLSYNLHVALGQTNQILTRIEDKLKIEKK